MTKDKFKIGCANGGFSEAIVKESKKRDLDKPVMKVFR